MQYYSLFDQCIYQQAPSRKTENAAVLWGLKIQPNANGVAADVYLLVSLIQENFSLEKFCKFIVLFYVIKIYGAGVLFTNVYGNYHKTV